MSLVPGREGSRLNSPPLLLLRAINILDAQLLKIRGNNNNVAMAMHNNEADRNNITY
jgi:hypothetical protein